MSGKRGCFKNGCFGCLGLLAVLVLFIGISGLWAFKSLDSVQMEDRWLAVSGSVLEDVAEDTIVMPATVNLKGGRVILNLAQGEFEVKPAGPGQPLSVQAKYDSNNFVIKESYQVLPDSTWVYQLDYDRTQSGMQALLQALMGGGGESKIIVYLPTDVPLDLDFDITRGSLESEFSGLWLKDADIDVGQGGFVFSVSEPLQHPMGDLNFSGSMGGIVVSKLGNASPRRLGVSWSMGGGDMDLRGQWANDCDIRLEANMGGMDVRVPDDIGVTGLPKLDAPKLEQNQELPQHVLRFEVDVSMGGFEVRR